MFSLPNFTEFLGFASIIPVYLVIVFYLISIKNKPAKNNKQSSIFHKAT